MDKLYSDVNDLEFNSVINYYKKRKIDRVSMWDLVNTIDNLLYERSELREELADKESKFNPYKEYGVSENEFH